jgi:hypothetical protein
MPFLSIGATFLEPELEEMAPLQDISLAGTDTLQIAIYAASFFMGDFES